MDKQQSEISKVKLNELSHEENSNHESGCIHYKRKAKFVVSIDCIVLKMELSLTNDKELSRQYIVH